MPKNSVFAIAAFAFVAFLQIQPATAQHWDGYGHGVHHHSDHGHFHGHYQGSHNYVHDYSYNYQDSHRGHAPIALGYVDMPLNQHHSSNVYCPDDVGCPLQCIQPAQGGLSQQNPPYQDAPYLGAPRQYEIPNGAAGSVGSYNDHANDGHDHGDLTHDGHSHGPANPSIQNPAATFGTPDRQPMTAPTLPNRNVVPQSPDFNAPSNRQAPSDNAPTNDGPIRMDGPPPSLTNLNRSSVDVG